MQPDGISFHIQRNKTRWNVKFLNKIFCQERIFHQQLFLAFACFSLELYFCIFFLYIYFSLNSFKCMAALYVKITRIMFVPKKSRFKENNFELQIKSSKWTKIKSRKYLKFLRKYTFKLRPHYPSALKEVTNFCLFSVFKKFYLPNKTLNEVVNTEQTRIGQYQIGFKWWQCT